MGTARRNIAYRTLEFFPVVQPVAENHLRVIVRSRILKFGKLSKDVRRALIAQHFST